MFVKALLMETLPFDILYYHLGVKYPHAYNLLTRSNKYWHSKLQPRGAELRKKWTRKVVAVFEDKNQKHFATLLPNGQYHGEYTIVDTKTNKQIELISYNNGVKHGKYEKRRWRTMYNIRFATTTAHTTGKFHNGQLHGQWSVWEDGRRYEARFNHGKLDGKEVLYHKSNIYKVAEITHYKDGLKDGICQKFNDEGAKIIECKYKNGLLHGWYIEYVPVLGAKSRAHIHAHYNKGILDGERIFYKTDGSILRIETWVDGGLYQRENRKSRRK